MLRRAFAFVADQAATRRSQAPACGVRAWPPELRAAFPGARPVESWTGEGAAFARYRSGRGPLFLKYIPAGWRDARAAERLRREAAYLRDLAPLAPVAHAPHLHDAASQAQPLAHLLTRDLTDETTGWGWFQTDAQREQGLHDVVRLLAQLHAFWAGPGQAHLRGPWVWQPASVVRRQPQTDGLPEAVRGAVLAAARDLPALLERAPVWTLVHGDIHAGQVLWPRGGAPAILIDYGQVHPSLPGEDLAHLLALRLDPAERARLGPELRDAYQAALAEAGLPLSRTELAAQERAGLAINVLSTARQARRRQSRGVQQALEAAAQAWWEGEA
ncbi:aminoglycoside phosphotransferase family protein [Deinococcus sp. HMF7604]|uniref:phosphotransferase family protein n=1 Tax=Deinococcus betulae TaxID=2873312 RepID=UPI001CCE9FD1|nr:aminoglycoside phosphotransferase family protein [Deinococcus betulae]MBZ9752322.1 aminoglycoside phosphotransferase family protein [Deinococcus betulae]